MSTQADGREIYVIGKEAFGNREVVIQEDDSIHDFPATAEFTYADEVTRFPYELAA
jgi:hypothetical protein